MRRRTVYPAAQCRSSGWHCSINQSVNQSINQSIKQSIICYQSIFFLDVTLQGDESINKVKHEKSIDIGKYGVTKEEIDQLKVEAKTVLTDKLLKKVVQTEAVRRLLDF